MFPSTDAASRLAIVDMGSNTARLVVFEYESGSWYQLVDSIREPVRLAEGFAETGRLQPEAIQRSIAALRLFADYGAATGIEPIEVFCTSAVRDAENRDQFLDQVEKLGLPYQILAGEDEARYGVHAVANSSEVDDAWVMDLGGGSAQLSRMENRRFVHGDAYPLGAVRTTERFFADGIKPDAVAQFERFVLDTLREEIPALRSSKDPLIVMGGSVRSLAGAAQATHRYPLAILHGYALQRDDLETVTERLLRSPLSQRRRIAGISPDRADILPAAALVFRTLLRATEQPQLMISGTGVREGIFYERFLPKPHRIDNLRDFSITNLRREVEPHPHVQQVCDFALTLFDELQPLHGLERADRSVLGAAALLHDVGTRVAFPRRHRHAAYLVNANPLVGFDHPRQALISTLVRYHRKGRPSIGAFGRLFDRDVSQRLLCLTACLRLAIQLERSRARRVQQLRVLSLDDPVVIEVTATSPPTVEIWEATKHQDLFQLAFGRALEFRFNPAAAT